MKTSVKNMVATATFTAIALVIYVLESYIPPIVPVPGVKIGLANAVTLIAMYIIGAKNAFWITVIRILLGNLFAGSIVSLLYSMAGGVVCFFVMLILKKLLKVEQIWAVSIFSAIAHSTAQILVAMLVMNTFSLLYYWFVLLISSVISGAFTGLCSAFTVNTLKKIKY